ncbi:MAG: hypothetical protein SCARUB_00288 [Candidatus Scalindua rubra]|uniref:Chordopoxvirus fusion protein n=1 Tax=Candidatus Scalindua rubra TaxID=1872076 RepID=A0A1E3XG03_9BACT|nr:MAG: hypothetical protein SCARUB_00288 [Candidatus Scalindua rubra]
MQYTADRKRKLEKVFDKKQVTALVEVIEEAYSELVKSGDFNELKGIVKDLAEAQKRTEIKVEELAEAQKRTEIKVEELAEAQKRTEIKVEELVEAQKRTETELYKLIQEHKKTREQVGGLSTTVGYTIENESYKALPGLLKRDYGIVIRGRLKRQYIKYNKGKYIEINIIGEASRNGKGITIIGEGKSQLSKKGVNEFIRKKLERVEGVYKDIFPILITHMISEPDVEEYAKKKGITLYYSYDF